MFDLEVKDMIPRCQLPSFLASALFRSSHFCLHVTRRRLRTVEPVKKAGVSYRSQCVFTDAHQSKCCLISKACFFSLFHTLPYCCIGSKTSRRHAGNSSFPDPLSEDCPCHSPNHFSGEDEADTIEIYSSRQRRCSCWMKRATSSNPPGSSEQMDQPMSGSSAGRRLGIPRWLLWQVVREAGIEFLHLHSCWSNEPERRLSVSHAFVFSHFSPWRARTLGICQRNGKR